MARQTSEASVSAHGMVIHATRPALPMIAVLLRVGKNGNGSEERWLRDQAKTRWDARGNECTDEDNGQVCIQVLRGIAEVWTRAEGKQTYALPHSLKTAYTKCYADAILAPLTLPSQPPDPTQSSASPEEQSTLHCVCDALRRIWLVFPLAGNERVAGLRRPQP